jgi:hypothetical protein
MTSSPVELRTAKRSLDLDPMQPEVQALFCGLSAERGLVARLALNALCWRCGGAPQSRARVEELWVGVVRKPRDLRRVLRRAEALEREIAEALTPNAADLHMGVQVRRDDIDVARPRPPILSVFLPMRRARLRLHDRAG